MHALCRRLWDVLAINLLMQIENMGNWMILKDLRTWILGKCLELDDEAKEGVNDMHVVSSAVLRVGKMR